MSLIKIYESIIKRSDPDAVAFDKALMLQNYSLARRVRYLYSLKIVMQITGKPLREVNKEDMEKVMAYLNNTKPNTRYTVASQIKVFYRWLRYGKLEGPYPPEVDWIRARVKLNERTIPQVLTEDEIASMINAAENPRDKAFIAVLAEGGFRIGEILPAKIRDVVFDEKGAKISVRGKTGPRIVRLITSVPLLSQWLASHPRKQDQEAPLWISSYGQTISYQQIVKHIKKYAKKAGIQKRIYPHLFRHSAATRDSSFLTDRELTLKYGWSGSSRMPAFYSHISTEQLDEKLIQLYSGKPVETKPKFVLVKCPRCGADNTPGANYCTKCGSPLNPEEIAKSEVEPEIIKEYEERLRKLSEELEVLKQKLKGFEGKLKKTLK